MVIGHTHPYKFYFKYILCSLKVQTWPSQQNFVTTIPFQNVWKENLSSQRTHFETVYSKQECTLQNFHDMKSNHNVSRISSNHSLAVLFPPGHVWYASSFLLAPGPRPIPTLFLTVPAKVSALAD
jgi:hypothetical protein